MRLHRLLRTIAVLACASLAACANIPADFRFDPSKDEGLVVGSITYESALGLFSLVVVGDGDATAAVRPKIDVGYSMYPPLGPTYDDALKAKGGTFAVVVPSGSYKIVGWVARQGYKVSLPSRRFDIPFIVERGKASYVGNLNFSPDWEVSLRDRSERDLSALKGKYAAMASAPVAYALENDTDLKNVGGAYQTTMEVPPMPLIVPVKR